MSQVWALTKLVVRESFRKQLFVLLGIASFIILVVPFTIPSTDPLGQLQIVESWLFSCIGFFGLVIILFLAGTSLPSDLRTGRLTTLMTKPVYRPKLLVSKFLGFSLILLFFVILTGTVGYLVLLGVDLTSGESLLGTHQKITPDVFQFELPGDGDQTVFSGEMSSGDDGSDRVVVYASRTTSPIALWGFEKKGANHYQKPPVLLLRLQGRGARNRFNVRARIFVEVPLPVKQAENNGDRRLEWKRVQRRTVDFRQNRVRRVPVWPKSVREHGKNVFDIVDRFRVKIALANPAGSIQFSRNSVFLEGPRTSYLWNYLKGLFLMFLLFLLLTGFMMAVTSMVSGPLSICMGLLFYATGGARGFLEDALHVTRETIRIRYQHFDGGTHHHQPTLDVPTWMLEYSEFVTSNVLAIIPEFGLFRPGGTLARWQIQHGVLFDALGQMLLYTLMFLLVGMVVFQFRELKA